MERKLADFIEKIAPVEVVYGLVANPSTVDLSFSGIELAQAFNGADERPLKEIQEKILIHLGTYRGRIHVYVFSHDDRYGVHVPVSQANRLPL